MLFPPDLVMATLRVAWIRETAHLQLQIEVINPVTNELYAMASVPHRDANTPRAALEAALAELEVLWTEVCDPDPF